MTWGSVCLCVATPVGSRLWDQEVTQIHNCLVWEFNSKAQPLFALKRTHYWATLHTVSVSRSQRPRHSEGPNWDLRKQKVKCWYMEGAIIPEDVTGSERMGEGLVICQWSGAIMKCLSPRTDNRSGISSVMRIWMKIWGSSGCSVQRRPRLSNGSGTDRSAQLWKCKDFCGRLTHHGTRLCNEYKSSLTHFCKLTLPFVSCSILHVATNLEKIRHETWFPNISISLHLFPNKTNYSTPKTISITKSNATQSVCAKGVCHTWRGEKSTGTLHQPSCLHLDQWVELKPGLWTNAPWLRWETRESDNNNQISRAHAHANVWRWYGWGLVSGLGSTLVHWFHRRRHRAIVQSGSRAVKLDQGVKVEKLNKHEVGTESQP